ncbi:response regulator [Trinickia sp. NRRL B-1857]|uniref:Hpt domain-containing response regulator n=1 Tax=Trinickia sp. NRRL B-1857 TaxID=3162879 RepID=UPI003D2C5363
MLERHDSTEIDALSDARILVVDDDALARFILADQLDALGCRGVDTASDGVDALTRALSRRYHLVITDLCMPKMDGQALLTAMRAHGLSMPVIAGTAWREPISAGAQAGGLPFATEPPCGFAAVLRKPFSMTQLRGLLHTHIGRAPDDTLAARAAQRALQEAFAATWPDDERALHAALAAADPQALLARLHRLHGVLAMIGAARAREACAQLQRHLHGEGVESNARRIARFLQLCARVGRRTRRA